MPCRPESGSRKSSSSPSRSTQQLQDYACVSPPSSTRHRSRGTEKHETDSEVEAELRQKDEQRTALEKAHRAELAQAQGELVTLRNQQQDLSIEFGSLQREFLQLQSEKETITRYRRTDLKHWQDSSLIKDAGIESLRNDVSVGLEREKALDQQLQDLKQKSRDQQAQFQNQNMVLTKKREELETRVRNLSADAQARNSSRARERSSLEDSIRTLREEATERARSREREQQASMAEVNYLSDQTDQKYAFRQYRKEDFQAEIAHLQNQVVELQTVVGARAQKSGQNKGGQQANFHNLQGPNKALSAQFHDRQRFSQSLSTQVDTLQQAHQTLSMRIDNIERSDQHKKVDTSPVADVRLQNVENELQCLGDTVGKYKSDRTEVERKLTHVQDLSGDSQGTVSLTEKNNEKLRREQTRLREKLQTATQNAESLQQQNIRMQKEVKDLDAARSKLEADKLQLQQKVQADKLSHENYHLSAENRVKTQKSRIDELECVMEELLQEFSGLYNDHKVLRTRFNEQAEQYNMLCDRYNEDLEWINEKIDAGKLLP